MGDCFEGTYILLWWYGKWLRLAVPLWVTFSLIQTGDTFQSWIQDSTKYKIVQLLCFAPVKLSKTYLEKNKNKNLEMVED